MDTRKRTTIRLPLELYKRIRIAAFNDDVVFNDAITNALEHAYPAPDEKPARPRGRPAKPRSAALETAGA